MGKVIRNGMCAVLVSPGFGAGWSTWAHKEEQKEWALFSPEVVAWVEGGKKEDIAEIVKAAFGDDYFYLGGARDLKIEWVRQGEKFLIDEYDGSESLSLLDELPLRSA